MPEIAEAHGLLITGNESSLASAIAAEAGRRPDPYCAALVPNRLPYPLETLAPAPANSITAGQIPLAWNPGSPVSARALALAAENRLGRIDEAILVCSPPTVRKNAEDLNPANIEIIVDDHIKGWFFLVKELAALFKARGSGSLALALSDTVGGDDTDLVGPSVSASFRSLAQGLLASSLAAPYDVYGFTVPAGAFLDPGDDNGVGAFVFRTMADSRRNAGKWHKFGSKLPFLKR